jgi:3-carboxy-cis,cis-muconate cycloisomerase
VRDTIAEVGCFLGLVTGSCGKIAFDVKLLMQTEVEEVYEPFHEGRGSSSTMPQKRNPISSVYITAQTAIVKQLVAALLEAMIEDHERATGPWEIEWITLPEIFMLAAGALAQTKFVVSGMQVNEKKMRENIDITKGPPARNWKKWSTLQITWASPVRWWIACWRCAKKPSPPSASSAE